MKKFINFIKKSAVLAVVGALTPTIFVAKFFFGEIIRGYDNTKPICGFISDNFPAFFASFFLSLACFFFIGGAFFFFIESIKESIKGSR